MLFGLWLLTLNFAIGVLITTLLKSKYSPLELRPDSVTILAGTIGFHGVALVLVCWLLRAHQVTLSSAFGFSKSRLWWPVALGFASGLLAVPLLHFVGELWAQLLRLLHVKVESQLPVQMLQASSSMEVRLLIGIVAIFNAPVVEEMIFRGILYPTLKRYDFRRTALWGTAVLFSAVHHNLLTFVPLVVFALVLAWLYEATDTLLAPIVAHSCFNLVNFIEASLASFN
jgi:hypothetical protein